MVAKDSQEAHFSDSSTSSLNIQSTVVNLKTDDLGIANGNNEENNLFSSTSWRHRFNQTKQSILEKKWVSYLLQQQSSILRSLSFIFLWYFFSTLLSVYNKFMFGERHGNIRFPLFITSFHMLIQFTCSFVVLWYITPQHKPKEIPTLRNYSTKIVPCGLATGLDIGLSNASLQTISLTLYTMCKSSVPVFVLLFAFILKLEKPSKALIGIIILISFGVLLMVMKTPDHYKIIGIIQVLIASSLSGLRWGITQILLDKNNDVFTNSNPVVMNLFLTPVMCITLFVCGCFIENLWKFVSLAERISAFSLFVKFSLGGFIAFCMTIAEFKLIGETSVVALSVAGIFKEVLTILISMYIFGDTLAPINVVGLLISIGGIVLFNIYRVRKNSKTHQFIQIEEDHGIVESEME